MSLSGRDAGMVRYGPSRPSIACHASRKAPSRPTPCPLPHVSSAGSSEETRLQTKRGERFPPGEEFFLPLCHIYIKLVENIRHSSPPKKAMSVLLHDWGRVDRQNVVRGK